MSTKRYPLPSIGETFQHRCRGGEVYTLTVIKTSDGVGFKINQFPDLVFASPLKAAKYLVPEGQSVNGRAFWNMNKSS